MDAGAQMLLLQVQRQHASTLIDAASKLAFHSKRAQLVLADLPPAHGHGGAALPQLLSAPDAADVLFRPEHVLSTAEAEALPKPPLEVGVTPHWLAVDGVQPATAENAQPRAAPRVAGSSQAYAEPAPAAAARTGAGAPAAGSVPGTAAAGQQGGGDAGGGGSLAAGLPLRHSLPDELQLYYDMVRRMLQSKQGSALDARAVTTSLATDPGLQPVLPYLAPLLAQEVGANLADAQHLRLLLSAIRAVLSNAHLHLVPYIHHLLPAVITCLVARNLGAGDDHWAVRDEAGTLLAQVAQRSRERNDELSTALARVQQSLAAVLFDAAPQTQYGALVGLSAFGAPCLLQTVVPQLERYAQLLQGEQTTTAGLHVRSALMVAMGRCMAWSGGSEARAISKRLADNGLEEILASVGPAPLPHL